MEVINKFINAKGKMFKKENIKLAYRVYIIFLVLILCLLPFSGGFISISGIIIVIFYSSAACVYNHNTIKNTSTNRKIFMAHLLLIGYLFIICNLCLYSIPKIMKLNIDKLIIMILLYELFCMALGCFNTYFSIKKGKIEKYRPADALAISIIFILSVCWILFFRSYASTTPNKMEAFITLATITICCCALTFYIGKTFIPLLYFIKKLNINEFNFSRE